MKIFLGKIFRSIGCLTVLLFALPLIAQDGRNDQEIPEQLIVQYAHQSVVRREAMMWILQANVEAAEARLRMLRRMSVSSRGQGFRSRDAKDRAIQEATNNLKTFTSELNRLADPKMTYFGKMQLSGFNDPQIGSIGTLENSITVQQVIGDRAILGRPFSQLCHIQLLEPHHAVNDSNLDVTGSVFWICGTTTYNTAIGSSNTVQKYQEIVIPDELRELFTRKQFFRTWHDKSETFKVNALLMPPITRGQIVLFKTNGEEITVKVSQLCEADKSHVDEILNVIKSALDEITASTQNQGRRRGRGMD